MITLIATLLIILPAIFTTLVDRWCALSGLDVEVSQEGCGMNLRMA
jgi:hypothetical protein